MVFTTHKKYSPRFPTVKEVMKMQKSKPEGNVRLYSRHPPFGDRDKDGTPNFIDCYPANPRKQGLHVKHIPTNLARMSQTFAEKVGRPIGIGAAKTIEGVKKYVKDYPEKQRQRRAREIERLKQQQKILREQKAIEKQRAELRKLRGDVGFSSPSSAIMGTGFLTPSYFGETKSVVKPIRRRKRKRRRKK